MNFFQGPKGYATFLFNSDGVNIFRQDTGEFMVPQLFYWQHDKEGPTAPYYGGFSSLALCLKQVEYMKTMPNNLVKVDFRSRRRV
jgi:hypothetical protein